MLASTRHVAASFAAAAKENADDSGDDLPKASD
jgi:hypothetical protein